MRAVLLITALGLGIGCDSIDAGGELRDGGPADDPLAIPAEAIPEPGSLDDIHARIIVRACSGQPGLCHNGQFEPNLSTPALTYENLAGRPSLERHRALRVDPGDPGNSFLVDKLRYRNDVSTQMPLGAEPLPEDEIAEIEAWIAAGALRRPDADPPPMPNNPPQPPELAFYDAAGVRLGPGASVAVGETLTLRMSVRDFETDDEDVVFPLFVVQTPDGRDVVLEPSQIESPQLGLASYDPAGPMGNGDVMNYTRSFTVTSTLELRDQAGVITPVDASGLSFTLLGLYLDGFPAAGGIATFTISPATVVVL